MTKRHRLFQIHDKINKCKSILPPKKFLLQSFKGSNLFILMYDDFKQNFL